MEQLDQMVADGGEAPTGYPDREALLRTMLEATGRRGVPVRRAFVQALEADADGSRTGPMASLVNDTATLDVYLLIHALASSRTPYDARYQSTAWAIMAGFTRHSEMSGAKSKWSRSVTRLAKLGLIRREGSGRSVRYYLLNESGNGDPYTRPKTVDDDRWFTVPYTYWLNGWDQKLSSAEKIMLLIALSSKPSFELPYNRAPAWYGISESTAKRGLTRLAEQDQPLIMRYVRWVPDAASKTLWRTVMSYRLIGPWSAKSRAAAMRRRRSDGQVTFEEAVDANELESMLSSPDQRLGPPGKTLESRLQDLGSA